MTENLDKYPDRIAEMFQNRSVFITGGTGFLGKVLIEKLLRCCNGVKTIYLLIRPKKNKTPEERLNDIFNSPLFNTLKEQQPNAFKKCVVICGDVSELNLGISESDRKKLQDDVEFIYHVAASTRFEDTIRASVQINTRGTKFVLDLAGQCKKLKVFIHVSTAYAFPKEKILYEKTYPPPANPHEVLNSINWFKEHPDGLVTKKLLGDCPNTYTFSKSLAEGLVAEQMDKLPCVILRPSVVVPVWLEPMPGWCNNLQGPSGLFVGAGKGIIRSMWVDSKSYADFLPADIVINGFLLAAWNYVNYKDKRVHNVTSSMDYNLTWEEIIELGKEVALHDMPFNGVVWYPGGSMKNSKWQHMIAFYLFQIIPALFIDLLLICLGYKPILYKIQRRIQKGSEMFEFYTTRTWNFCNESVLDVRKKINPRETKIYKVNAEGADIKKYFTDCIHYARLYILKESDESLPAARRHLKIMWFVDVLCKSLFTLAIIYYFYKWIFMPIYRK